MTTASSFSPLIGLMLIVLVAAQLEPHNFDETPLYWPSEFKRSPSGGGAHADSELFAFPGLRGLRGKRDPTYHKRVPMMSLKGLRGKRARFDGEDVEQ